MTAFDIEFALKFPYISMESRLKNRLKRYKVLDLLLNDLPITDLICFYASGRFNAIKSMEDRLYISRGDGKFTETSKEKLIKLILEYTDD